VRTKGADADTETNLRRPGKEAPTVDFLPQNAQFFYQLEALADENFNAVPANGRPTRTVDRADERVVCKDFSRLGMGCT
jgi:hypothetical protein